MAGLLPSDPVTLSQALNDRNVIPGDTIRLLPGTYTQSDLQVNINGLPDFPIMIVPDTPGTVTIRPSGGYRALHFAGVHDLIFSGLIIDAINCDTESVKIDSSSKRITFDNCELLNGKTGGISIIDIGTDDCVVKNCKIHNIGTNGFHHGVYVATGPNRTQVYGNEIYSCSGHGIHFYGGDLDVSYSIHNNYIHNVGTRGIGCYYGNADVYNNIIRTSGELGIAIFYSTRNANIYFNTIQSSGQFGIYVRYLTNTANINIIDNCCNASGLGVGISVVNTNPDKNSVFTVNNNIDNAGANIHDGGGTDIYPTLNNIGISIPNYTLDFNGKTRIVPYIGAIEL